MTLRYLVLALLYCLMASCSPSQEYTYEKQGIRFTCPEGWRITDEETEESSSYLSVEREGLNSSGLWILTWVKGNRDLATHLQEFQESFGRHYLLDKTDIQFGSLTEITFNNYPAVCSDYTATIMGLRHRGRMYSFQQADKTFCIVRQEALEDRLDNEAGFRLIEHSFSCD